MLRELISIFRGSDPLAEVGDRFARMLRLTQDMTFAAGQILFDEEHRKVRTEQIFEWDAEVNELERSIRRWVLTHLAAPGTTADLPYSLLLISLVKDVERLGDYAKNLSQIVSICPAPLPEGHVLSELMTIRRRIELVFQSCLDVFSSSGPHDVVELIKQARETARRCDILLSEVGRSDYNAAATTAFILATRYYKRIGAHVLNVLSSMVVPLDNVDFFDEDESPTSLGTST